MSMLLIDATNINVGGGGVLLEYFVQKLDERKVKYMVLVAEHFSQVKVKKEHKFVVIGTILKRKKNLKEAVIKWNPDVLLCFGNFPPPFKMKNVKVFTFFHNANLVQLPPDLKYCIKEKLQFLIRRQYIAYYKKNTNFFICQTGLIKEKIAKTYRVATNTILVNPFYNLERILKIREEIEQENVLKDTQQFVYISYPYSYKNHNCLLDAWEVLFKKGLKPILILTLPKNFNPLSDIIRAKIGKLCKQGLNIQMETFSFKESLKKTYTSTYCIFPSLTETIGLGLVEAYFMGCKILAADKPYVYQIVEPSATFNPYSTEDIVLLVEKALSESLPKPKLYLNNEISQLIDRLLP